MQIFVKNSVVVATHDDGQNVDPIAAYGAGTVIQPLPSGASVPEPGDAWAPDVVVRIAPGPTLIKAVTDDAWPKVKMRDRDVIAGRSTVPESLGAVARAAAAMGTTPKAWFDAVFGTSS